MKYTKKLKKLERDNCYLNSIYLHLMHPGSNPMVIYYLEVEKKLWEARTEMYLKTTEDRKKNLKKILDELWELLTHEQQEYLQGK